MVEKKTRSPCCKLDLETGHAVVDLVLGGPVQGHAELLIDVGREAGAVEGLRAAVP